MSLPLRNTDQAPDAGSREHFFGRKIRTLAPALLAGCGFCAAFGWVWFAGLFIQVIADSPEVFSGTFFSGGGISAFSIALFGGFALSGCLARRLAVRDGRIAAPLLHGGAFVCMAGGLFAGEALPLLSAALFGLAASGCGVYWAARLFGLPPLLTGLGLACAALLACVLSPAFPVFEPSVFFPAGIVLALGLALTPVRSCPKINASPGLARLHSHKRFQAVLVALILGQTLKGDCPARQKENNDRQSNTSSDEVLSIALLSSSFFASGVITAAAPLPSPANLSAVAGMVAAVACCARIRGRIPEIPLLTGGAVLLAALLLVFFPSMSGAFSFLGGFWEGAALVGIAVLGKEGAADEKPGILPRDFSRAGFCLAAIFILVNLGGAIGSVVTRTGDTGGLLLATVFAAFCPPALWLIARRNRSRGKNASSAPEQPAKSGEGAASQSAVPSPPPTLWSRLTRRECEISELLIREKSNPEICAALFVSENTVRTHIKNIYRKTGAAGREELKTLLRESK